MQPLLKQYLAVTFCLYFFKPPFISILFMYPLGKNFLNIKIVYRHLAPDAVCHGHNVIMMVHYSDAFTLYLTRHATPIFYIYVMLFKTKVLSEFFRKNCKIFFTKKKKYFKHVFVSIVILF